MRKGVGVALAGPSARARRAIRSARSAVGRPLLRRPRSMFSRTVFQGNSANCWNTTARSGPGAVTGRPLTLTVPDVGASKPATMRRQVVLPQPDGPTIATNSSSATSRSMSVEHLDASAAAEDACRPRRNGWSPCRPLGLEAAAPAHRRLRRAQQRCRSACPTMPIAIMPAITVGGRDVGLGLHHHEADAGRGDDQLGADERLPAEAGRRPAGPPRSTAVEAGSSTSSDRSADCRCRACGAASISRGSTKRAPR